MLAFGSNSMITTTIGADSHFWQRNRRVSKFFLRKTLKLIKEDNLWLKRKRLMWKMSPVGLLFFKKESCLKGGKWICQLIKSRNDRISMLLIWPTQFRSRRDVQHTYEARVWSQKINLSHKTNQWSNLEVSTLTKPLLLHKGLKSMQLALLFVSFDFNPYLIQYLSQPRITPQSHISLSTLLRFPQFSHRRYCFRWSSQIQF